MFDTDYVLKDELPDFDDVRDFLQGITESVYESGDVYKLEHCLDELRAMFEMEGDTRDPVLEKKNENRLMHFYLGYQRAHIENMKGGRNANTIR